MLFLLLCEMAISLFSKQYFKLHFYTDILLLAQDSVPNIRLKLCGILPRLKSVLSLPSDHVLLQQLEDTIEKLVLSEKDTDVLQAVQKSIHDLVRRHKRMFLSISRNDIFTYFTSIIFHSIL